MISTLSSLDQEEKMVWAGSASLLMMDGVSLVAVTAQQKGAVIIGNMDLGPGSGG